MVKCDPVAQELGEAVSRKHGLLGTEFQRIILRKTGGELACDPLAVFTVGSEEQNGAKSGVERSGDVFRPVSEYGFRDAVRQPFEKHLFLRNRALAMPHEPDLSPDPFEPLQKGFGVAHAPA
ncbi:MAG: hypothetical protein BWY82_01316 [Verrucomicrobia bacterium ADurb.Bin474]|nr:MAG: hypothetical protein BWY82_01316 [Verrucomicrobia bacterium ADurb.Bin474]